MCEEEKMRGHHTTAKVKKKKNTNKTKCLKTVNSKKGGRGHTPCAAEASMEDNGKKKAMGRRGGGKTP